MLLFCLSEYLINNCCVILPAKAKLENELKMSQKIEASVDGGKVLKGLVAIVIAALVVLCFMAFVYFYFFGTMGFSDSQEVWGQFGDFIGGVANPLMSFLALLAIVLTIVLQNKQTEPSKAALELSRQELAASREEISQSRIAAQEQVAHLKAEASKADVYRTIQILEARLEGLYREPIYFVSNETLRKRELYFLLTFATPDALRQIIPANSVPDAQYENELMHTKSVLMHLHLTIVKISMQLTFLVRIADSDPVLFFYEATLNHLAKKLKEIGYLPEDDEAAMKMGAEIRRTTKEARNIGSRA